ncbi:hypothetical protein Sa4125_33560 [Aureimonas sp. SA4125]|nr:hypothetical protein Sa4125_33560 [Aureimonas sp. SA4125]
MVTPLRAALSASACDRAATVSGGAPTSGRNCTAPIVVVAALSSGGADCEMGGAGCNVLCPGAPPIEPGGVKPKSGLPEALQPASRRDPKTAPVIRRGFRSERADISPPP